MQNKNGQGLEQDLAVVLIAISKVTKAMATQLQHQKQKGDRDYDGCKLKRSCSRITSCSCEY